MDNKWLMSLVLVLIGFVLGYLASFSAWGSAPRLWMMGGYGGNYNDGNLRWGGTGAQGYGMWGMMGYPVQPGRGLMPIDGVYPTSTPDGRPINY